MVTCAQAAALPAPQTLPAPYMAPSWQQPAALEPAAYPAYSQPVVYAQPQAYQQALPQQPQLAPYQGYQAAPVSPGHYGPPQSPGYAPAPANGAYHGAQPGVYAPLQPAPQQQPMLLAPQPAPAPVQYVAQQPQAQPQIVCQAQQPAPLPAPAQLPAPQPLPAPVQLPAPVTLPAAVNAPLPAPVTLPAPGPAPAGRGDPRGAPQGGPGSSAPALPDFLTSLLQQGLIRVQGGEGGVGAAGGGADGAGESDDEGVPRRRYDPQKLQFLAERIKVGGCLSLPARVVTPCLPVVSAVLLPYHEDVRCARCTCALPSPGLTAVRSCPSSLTRIAEHHAVILTAASSTSRCKNIHHISGKPHALLCWVNSFTCGPGICMSRHTLSLQESHLSRGRLRGSKVYQQMQAVPCCLRHALVSTLSSSLSVADQYYVRKGWSVSSVPVQGCFNCRGSQVERLRASRHGDIYLRIKLHLLRKQGSIERRGICNLHFSRETPAGGSSCVAAAWAANVWRGHSRPGS